MSRAVRPLRVLHLMSCQGWSSDAYWAGRVARELSARGHCVTFVAREGTEERVLGRLRDLGLPEVVTLGFRGRRAPRGAVEDLLAVRRLLAAHDVVHVHRGKEHWLAAVANHLAGRSIPLVRTRHIMAPVSGNPFNRWLYRRATAHVLAVSHAIRRRYIDSGLLAPEAVTALLGGVDHQRFTPSIDGRPFRRTHGIPDSAPVIGVLAGLRAMKGHVTLLEAAPRILSARPRARFVLVGEGPERARIIQRIAELGLTQQVVMAGFVRDPEAVVAAFDVAVYPSASSDGMGRVLFEYMASGRPIVATTVGLAPEVFAEGATALLVPPDDPAQMGEAIVRVLSTPGLATRMAEAARALVEARYTGAAVATAVEGLYRRLVVA